MALSLSLQRIFMDMSGEIRFLYKRNDHTFNIYVYLYVNALSVACNYGKALPEV